jgi:hypothetical protein
MPTARPLCFAVKPRIRELAGAPQLLMKRPTWLPWIGRYARRDGVGLIAVEILLALYDRNGRLLVLGLLLSFDVNLSDKLNIRDARVRENLASALVYLNPVRADRGQQTLRRVFGLGK